MERVENADDNNIGNVEQLDFRDVFEDDLVIDYNSGIYRVLPVYIRLLGVFSNLYVLYLAYLWVISPAFVIKCAVEGIFCEYYDGIYMEEWVDIILHFILLIWLPLFVLYAHLVSALTIVFPKLVILTPDITGVQYFTMFPLLVLLIQSIFTSLQLTTAVIVSSSSFPTPPSPLRDDSIWQSYLDSSFHSLLLLFLFLNTVTVGHVFRHTIIVAYEKLQKQRDAAAANADNAD